MKAEYLYGIHPVREALAAKQRRFREIYIVRKPSPQKFAQIEAQAEKRGIPVKRVTPDLLSRLCRAETHQGIAAKVSPLALKDWKRTLAADGLAASSLVLILDSLKDPHNFGALIRTAISVGTHAVLFPKDRSVAPSPTVSKISAGALEHAPLSQVTNLVSTIQQLKDSNYWVFGLDGNAKQSIFEVDFSARMAIVVGSEGKGMRPLVKKQCDHLVRIPQTGPVSSLNASVAGAIALYEAYRQRKRG